jgi:glycosyltransferase involved in cell wall biosynthesis
MIRVAILHYHLRAGGVGSVVRSQARCLEGAAEVHLLLGEPPRVDPGLPFSVLPGLAYGAGLDGGAGDAAALAAGIERALRDRFAGSCDVLHAHNPLIRKSGSLPRALDILARRGARILIQAHDFAEDFRPDVYYLDQDYPGGCFFAAINARDRENLVASGIDSSCAFVLPNAMGLTEEFEPRRGFAEESALGRRLALYPVRAIRRKNIGEALLLSRFLPGGAEIAVTLPPTSPRDIPTYRKWKEISAIGGYPVRFEAGDAAELRELYDRSFCALTTSVKEGFGFPFLDPPARGIPVVGRSVPYTVSDFIASGVELPGLYEGIRVPAEAVPAGELRAALSSRLEALRSAYASAYSRGASARKQSDELESILARLATRFEGETIDFGALDTGSQATALRRYDEDASFAKELASDNPFLGPLFEARLEPSAALGFMTLLFAGDARSLRRPDAAFGAAAPRPDSVALDIAAVARICRARPSPARVDAEASR